MSDRLPAFELSSDASAAEAAEIFARLEWRRSLSDIDVRALAYEYKTGNLDQCSQDAWAEYQHRFGDPDTGRKLQGPSVEFPKKASASASALRRARKRGAQGKTSRS